MLCRIWWRDKWVRFLVGRIDFINCQNYFSEMGVPSEKEFTELDWIQLNKEVRQADNEETTKERMLRKVQENPFVPIGCLATFCALSYGLWSFRHGRKQMSQYMMRTRIAAQGFTIVALVAGIAMSARNSITKD